MKRRLTVVLTVIMSLTLLLSQGAFAYDNNYYDDGEVGDKLSEVAKDAPTVTSTDDVVKLLWDSVMSKTEHTYFRAHKSLETVIEQPEEGKYGVSDEISYAFNYMKNPGLYDSTDYDVYSGPGVYAKRHDPKDSDYLIYDLDLEFHDNKEELAQADSKLKSIISECSDKPEAEKVRYMYEWMRQNVKPEKDSDEGYPRNCNGMYGCLFGDGTGFVCSTYALTIQRFCELAGIEAHILSTEEKYCHAFNVINIDGFWYVVDYTHPDDDLLLAGMDCLKDHTEYIDMIKGAAPSLIIAEESFYDYRKEGAIYVYDDNLPELIKETGGSYISVEYKDNKSIVTKDTLDALAETNKALLLENGDFTWNIYGPDIKNATKPIDLSASVSSGNASEYGLDSTPVLTLEFADNGTLPALMEFSFITNELEPADNLPVYYVKDGKLVKDDTTASAMKLEGGAVVCNVEMTHHSKFVVSNKELQADGNIITPEIKLSTTDFTYKYKVKTVKKKKKAIATVQRPIVSVLLNGKTISADNYDVAWSNENSGAIGEYAVTVTLKGAYSGKASAAYTIRPKAVSLKKVAKGKKKFTASWKKLSKNDIKYKVISGYELRYSTDPELMADMKPVSAGSIKAVKKAVSKLKSKTKYYVQLRTYKIVGGKRIYSKWSKTKSVKIN